MHSQVDDTAGYTKTRITRRVARSLHHLATIVFAAVHNNCATCHIVDPGQRDQSRAQRTFGSTRAVSFDVA